MLVQIRLSVKFLSYFLEGFLLDQRLLFEWLLRNVRVLVLGVIVIHLSNDLRAMGLRFKSTGLCCCWYYPSWSLFPFVNRDADNNAQNHRTATKQESSGSCESAYS
jgi:hypothetical protein